MRQKRHVLRPVHGTRRIGELACLISVVTAIVEGGRLTYESEAAACAVSVIRFCSYLKHELAKRSRGRNLPL